jgi:hypothetical protein
MPSPTELLKLQTLDRFQTIFSASPRKLREDAYRRAGIKNKGDVFSLRASGKNEVRTQRLYQAIGQGFELEEKVSEEVIRNYLFTRRDLLVGALDFLGVEHDQGLTDQDLDFIQELPLEKRQALRATLVATFAPEDVDLYLAYMNIAVA